MPKIENLGNHNFKSAKVIPRIIERSQTKAENPTSPSNVSL